MRELTFESIETVSQAEFAEWVERRPPGDLSQSELLNGRIVLTPLAGWPHGRIVARVSASLHGHVSERRLGHVLGSSQGFELPSGDTVAPEATFVSNERWRAAPPPELGKFLRVVPDLVVEVLSASTATHDRGEKKAIYERNGVREYWLVDPRARHVVSFRSEGGRFDVARIDDETAVLRSTVLPDLTAPVRELFGDLDAR